MMNRAYWDAMARDYDNEILSVFDHDKEGVIRRLIGEHADVSSKAADLGCGVGKFTPMLSEAFAQVEACDLSPQCLQATRAVCDGAENVNYHLLDFAKDPAPFEPVDFALCINVLLLPDLDANLRCWRFVTNQLAQNGTLLMVVPSVESIYLTDFRTVDWHLRHGRPCREAIAESFPRFGSARDAMMGIRKLDSVRTKHYLREELQLLLSQHGFEVTTLRKFEYAWSTVFDEPPEWLRAPYPWDWLVTARRL